MRTTTITTMLNGKTFEYEVPSEINSLHEEVISAKVAFTLESVEEVLLVEINRLQKVVRNYKISHQFWCASTHDTGRPCDCGLDVLLKSSGSRG